MNDVKRVARWLLPGIALVIPAGAVEIRGYSAARHDRFSGWPAAPVWNEMAWYDSRQFAGVAWSLPAPSNRRQMAMISPRHLVCASHVRPGIGTVVRFLALNGTVLERTVTAFDFVPNGVGGNSDVVVVTLSESLPEASGVKAFPYLNLGSEAAYVGTSLLVFGWDTKVGRGVISGFSTLNAPPQIASTRVCEYNYVYLFGGQDDAKLVGGDSGNPSFAMAGGRPVLVGVHSAVFDFGFSQRNYDAFIPHYVEGLNDLLDEDGYAMIPAYPLAVELVGSHEVTPSLLRVGEGGELSFTLENTDVAMASNVRMSFSFTAGKAPDGMSAPGWVVEAPTVDTRVLRRAGLAGEATAVVTAEWAEMPDGPIVVTAVHQSDGSPMMEDEITLEPAPSYADWSKDLAEGETGDDGDGDGVVNLLEYALGGDPLVASRFSDVSEAAYFLEPVVEEEGGRWVMRFPVREDAEIRGLSFWVVFAVDLGRGSWGGVGPVGLVTVDEPLEPVVEGWLLREISFDGGELRRFCRLRVEMNEGSVLPGP
jgi:hypothetical protein